MAGVSIIKKAMKRKLPTATVGLAAYNEEANIANLIRSILAQREVGFRLKQILINSDGSSDDTVKIIKSFKTRKVKVIDNKVRRGQPFRMRQIYKIFNSDYLIQTDADTLWGHENVIKTLVAAFESNENVAMCGGNIIPIAPKSLIQKAIYSSTNVYRKFADDINEGNNIFTVHGLLMAFRKNYIKTMMLPDVIANDKYLYLKCVSGGYEYKFVRDAIVYFELPLTLKDQIKQNTRFKVAKKQLFFYFDKEFLLKEYERPKTVFKLFIEEFIKHPIPVLYVFLVNRYCKILAIFKEKKISNILWDKLERTKVAVN